MCITSSIFGDENSCLFWESVFWILLDASYQLIVLVESCTCTHPPPRSRSTELMRRNKVCSRSSSTVGTFGSVALTFQDWTCNEEKAKWCSEIKTLTCHAKVKIKEHYQWFNQGKGLQGRALWAITSYLCRGWIQSKCQMSKALHARHWW